VIPAARRKYLAALILTTVSLGATIAPTAAAAPEGAEVTIKDFMFAPTNVKVKAGTSVTWTNKDDEPHTVVSDTGAFRSGALDTNENFSFRFDKPGTYHFVCSIHPKMIGTITVE
jgi:plastocyanin